MLREIGLNDIEDLFIDIPSKLKIKDIDLPIGLSQQETEKKLRKIAEKNQSYHGILCFTGGGIKPHYVPSVVKSILSRAEFYTSYTPYQSEASQGFLQAMFEYQSMICSLTGMEVTNASHYDGSTALAEAVRMALNVVKGGREKVIVSPALNPRYRDVVRTYLRGT